MATDFFLGESLVGDGNEIAHIDLIIGSKTGPAGAAFCNALTNNKDGFTTLLAVEGPASQCTTGTLTCLVAGQDIGADGDGEIISYTNPGATAKTIFAVVDSVESGVIPRDKADDYCVLVGVFIHWDASDDQKIYDFNYQAAKESIQRALAGKPTVSEVIAGAKTAKHPFASNAERKHGVGV